MTDRPANKIKVRLDSFSPDGSVRRTDHLATEEPLEVRISAGGATRTLAVTMRTPGSDFELVAGFLYGEGVIGKKEDIASIAYCVDRDVDPEQRFNIVTATLAMEGLPELPALDRHFYTSSACGVCGKASLDALEVRGCAPLADPVRVTNETLSLLPERLRSAQGVFDKTGGLHAAGLFDPAGDTVQVREDIGRHNAVNKVVGWALLNGRLPLGGHILMVSGRSSYEILQKSLAAEVPIVCSVSAPSSLAVELAQRFGMTLVGFLRGSTFNVYSGIGRVGSGALLDPVEGS